MHTGMLWFDNSQTELNIKIQKAADYYHKKYGQVPDLCLVHPNMLKDAILKKKRSLFAPTDLYFRVTFGLA